MYFTNFFKIFLEKSIFDYNYILISVSFKIPKYKLELYKSLNPKAKDVTEADIKTITLKTILANGFYNDLGLLVKGKIIFLLEAQSTWSINIILRIYIYLADTFKNYVEENKYNLYGTKRIELPVPELYVLYLGKEKINKKEYSFNEEYYAGKGSIDLKVKIITVRNKKDILKDYIEFAHRYDEFRKSKKNITEKDILNFINKCIRDNILREFLLEHREEVMSVETMLFDQDYVTKMYEHELFEDGKKEGMKQGIEQGRQEGQEQLLKNLYNSGLLSKKDYKKQLNLLVVEA